MTAQELYDLLDEADIKFKVVDLFEGLRILSFVVEEVEEEK